MKEMKKGTITSPLGFKTNAVACGIKKRKRDLALIYSIVKAQAAAVFTANRVKAAPVIIDREKLRRSSNAQAIVVNSGNANCCTGTRGRQDALKIRDLAAKYLSIKKNEVLIASTGVIGKFLPRQVIAKSLPELVSGLGFDKAGQTAAAIMTTDTYAKQTAVQFSIQGKRVTIGAIAKGAGMICPDMATMLCFITTDACISAALLKKALVGAVNSSFNRISVDGQMSTNDSVIILANGLAGNASLKGGSKQYKAFAGALEAVCVKLAKMIVADGEGATKMIEVTIKGAKTGQDAEKAARSIANSPLVKTMVAGSNPNWGRVPACIGASGAKFDEEKLEILLQGKKVYHKGIPLPVNKKALTRSLAKKDVTITADFHNGRNTYTMWTSDLTADYVRINTEYN